MQLKKLGSALLVCVLVFALLLTGCNDPADTTDGTTTTTSGTTTATDGDNGDGTTSSVGGDTTSSVGGDTTTNNGGDTTTNNGGDTTTNNGGGSTTTNGGGNKPNTSTSVTTSSTSKVEKEEPLLPSFIRQDDGTCKDRTTGVVFIDDECASKDVGSPDCLFYDCGGKIAVDGNHRAMFNNDGNRFIRADGTSSSNWWFSYKIADGITEMAFISYTHKNKAGAYSEPFNVYVGETAKKINTKLTLTYDANGDKDIGDGWIMRTYRVRNIDKKNKFLKFEFTAVDAGTEFYVPNIGRIRINNIDKMNDADRFLEGRVAQTFYIAANGNDSNDGLSPEKPWKSVAMLTGRYFQPGDKILFKSGDTFTGSFKVTGFGEANKRLTISTYGGDTPATINTRGEGTPATMELNADYVTVENLTLSNRLGTIGLSIGISHSGANKGIIVQNCTFKDVNTECSTFKYETGGILANSAGTEPAWFDGMVIRNNTFESVGRCGVFVKGSWNGRDGQSGGKYTNGGKEWTASRNLSITGNTMIDIFGDGILVIGANKLTIEKNFITNAFCIPSAKLKAARDRGENHATAALWTQNVHEAYIQYNDVGYTNLPEHGADGESFDIDALCTLHYIQYNYSHNNEGGFLLMCEADHADVYDIVYNTKHYIRFNLSLNDASKAGQGVFMATNTLGQMNIYNNTVVKNGSNSNLMNAWGAIQDYNFQNNIFYGDGCYKLNVSATCSGIKIDNNVITGGTPTGKTGLTVSNNKSGNPNFKNAAFTNPSGKTSKMADALKAFVPQTKIAGATNIKDNGGKDINGTTFSTLDFYGCIKH